MLACSAVGAWGEVLFAPNRCVAGISQLMLQRVVPGEFLWYHCGQVERRLASTAGALWALGFALASFQCFPGI